MGRQSRRLGLPLLGCIQFVHWFVCMSVSVVCLPSDSLRHVTAPQKHHPSPSYQYPVRIVVGEGTVEVIVMEVCFTRHSIVDGETGITVFQRSNAFQSHRWFVIWLCSCTIDQTKPDIGGSGICIDITDSWLRTPASATPFPPRIVSGKLVLCP